MNGISAVVKWLQHHTGETAKNEQDKRPSISGGTIELREWTRGYIWLLLQKHTDVMQVMIITTNIFIAGIIQKINQHKIQYSTVEVR